MNFAILFGHLISYDELAGSSIDENVYHMSCVRNKLLYIKHRTLLSHMGVRLTSLMRRFIISYVTLFSIATHMRDTRADLPQESNPGLK